MLKEGVYISENNENKWNSYVITMQIKETEKSYIFELISIESHYVASHMETFFRKEKRVILKKSKNNHAMMVCGDDSFTLYPYQAGIPYYFKLRNEGK